MAATAEPATAPCPHCLEATDLATVECPFCGGNLCVDVLAPAVADDRQRYRIAREVAGLGAPLPPFLEIHEALKAPTPGVLARHLSRGDAARLLDRLTALKLEGATRPSQQERIAPTPVPTPAAARPRSRSASGPFPRWAMVGAVVLALGLGLLFLTSRLRGWRPGRLPFAELAERGRRSTVVLTSGPCLGSGFFVTPDLLLTNAHVVCADDVEATLGSAKQSATIVNVDEELDLALLEVAGAGGTALPLGDAMDLREGDLVVAAGAPLGNEGTVVKGAVTRASTTVWGVLHIESSAALNPGNSGGPLVNDRGEAVGVISKSRMDGERRWALALPVNYVASWLPSGVAPDSRQWATRVAAAAQEAEKDLERFQSALQRPMLLGAHYLRVVVDPATSTYGAGTLLFVVAAPSAFRSAEETELTVRMTCGDIGPKRTRMSPWLALDPHLERSPKLGVTQLRPFLAWARKRSLTQQLVVATGDAWIGRPFACKASELALLDGDTVVDRIHVE